LQLVPLEEPSSDSDPRPGRQPDRMLATRRPFRIAWTAQCTQSPGNPSRQSESAFGNPSRILPFTQSPMVRRLRLGPGLKVTLPGPGITSMSSWIANPSRIQLATQLARRRPGRAVGGEPESGGGGGSSGATRMALTPAGPCPQAGRHHYRMHASTVGSGPGPETAACRGD
jgi:hypothetical protein